MKHAYIQVMAIGRRLWRPWSANEAERKSAEFVASATFVCWLAGITATGWAAIGGAPGLISGAAMTLLWVLGLLYFFGIAWPHLLLRFGLIVRAAPKDWTGAADQPPAEDGGEGLAAASEVLFEEFKAGGAWSPEHEAPPRRVEDIPHYLERTAMHRPILHTTAKIAGVALIVALVIADQPMLAAFYATPSAGWIVLDWLERRLPAGQAA